MKKNKYLIIFLALSWSYADCLYLKQNRCITDDYYFNNGLFYYTYSSTGSNGISLTFSSNDLEYGYEYVDNQCKKIQQLKDTHMDYVDYKFAMSLTGLLVGFTIFISIIFVFIRRK